MLVNSDPPDPSTSVGQAELAVLNTLSAAVCQHPKSSIVLRVPSHDACLEGRPGTIRPARAG
eukprot:9992515-Lingulodinium_polyedra.AAC.1